MNSIFSNFRNTQRPNPTRREVVIKIIFYGGYVCAILFLPWWVSVGIAIILIAYFQAHLFVLSGAVALDILYGAPPTYSAFGIPILYSACAAVLIFLSLFLRRRLLE